MKKVLLFLAQGFEEYEAAAFTDVFGWSRECGNEPVGLKTAGLRKKIKCTWTFMVRPELDMLKINVDDFDALAIPGGFEEAGFYEDAYDERFLGLIREFDRRNRFIASVCVGALPIGKSGVLKGRRATTYDLTDTRRNQLTEMGAIIQDEQIVVDGNIITSTGPATAVEVAFKLLEKLTDCDNAAIVRNNMRFI